MTKQLIVKQRETLSLSNGILNNNVSIAQFEMGLNLSKTLSKPTIRSIFKGENASVGFSVVKILVTRFMNSFGFSTKISEDNIEMITVDTLDNFGYESLEDIILFFKMARTGKFGETNRGVDSNLIFGKWFPVYLDKKAQLREEKHNDFKQQSKNQKAISMGDVEITYRKSLVKKLETDKENFIVNYTKNMDRQMLEDTIQHWSKDQELKNHVKMLKLQRRTIK
jgi:hypothetical protein